MLIVCVSLLSALVPPKKCLEPERGFIPAPAEPLSLIAVPPPPETHGDKEPVSPPPLVNTFGGVAVVVVVVTKNENLTLY